MVDYRGPERLSALSNGRLSAADAHAALSRTPALHQFERGELSPDDFAQAVVDEWRLDATPESFIADFETWPECFLPGVEAILNDLGRRFRLACFSNINIPHWRQAEALGLAPLFEQAFLSHELGARKPEARAYEKVIHGLGGAPSGILFFDDVADNVEAAQKAGMRAYHVAPADGVKGALARAGVL